MVSARVAALSAGCAFSAAVVCLSDVPSSTGHLLFGMLVYSFVGAVLSLLLLATASLHEGGGGSSGSSHLGRQFFGSVPTTTTDGIIGTGRREEQSGGSGLLPWLCSTAVGLCAYCGAAALEGGMSPVDVIALVLCTEPLFSVLLCHLVFGEDLRKDFSLLYCCNVAGLLFVMHPAFAFPARDSFASPTPASPSSPTTPPPLFANPDAFGPTVQYGTGGVVGAVGLVVSTVLATLLTRKLVKQGGGGGGGGGGSGGGIAQQQEGGHHDLLGYGAVGGGVAGNRSFQHLYDFHEDHLVAQPTAQAGGGSGAGLGGGGGERSVLLNGASPDGEAGAATAAAPSPAPVSLRDAPPPPSSSSSSNSSSSSSRYINADYLRGRDLVAAPLSVKDIARLQLLEAGCVLCAALARFAVPEIAAGGPYPETPEAAQLRALAAASMCVFAGCALLKVGHGAAKSDGDFQLFLSLCPLILGVFGQGFLFTSDAQAGSYSSATLGADLPLEGSSSSSSSSSSPPETIASLERFYEHLARASASERAVQLSIGLAVLALVQTHALLLPRPHRELGYWKTKPRTDRALCCGAVAGDDVTTHSGVLGRCCAVIGRLLGGDWEEKALPVATERPQSGALYGRGGGYGGSVVGSALVRVGSSEGDNARLVATTARRIHPQHQQQRRRWHGSAGEEYVGRTSPPPAAATAGAPDARDDGDEPQTAANAPGAPATTFQQHRSVRVST